MSGNDDLPVITGMEATAQSGGGEAALPAIVEHQAAAPGVTPARTLRSRATQKAPAVAQDDEGSATEDEDDALVTQPSQGSRVTSTPAKKGKGPQRDTTTTLTEGGFTTIASVPNFRRPMLDVVKVVNANAGACEQLRGIVTELQSGVPRTGEGAPGAIHDKIQLLEGRVESLTAELVSEKRTAIAAPPALTKEVDELSAKVGKHNAYLVKIGGSINTLNTVLPEQGARIDSLDAELASLKAKIAMLVQGDGLPDLPPIQPVPAPRSRVRQRSPSLDAATAAPGAARAQRPRTAETRTTETPGASTSATQLYPAISFGPWRSMARSAVAAYNSVITFINALPEARTLALPFAVAPDSNANFANAYFEDLAARDRIVEEWGIHAPGRFNDVAALPLSLPSPAPGTFVNAAKAAAAGKSAR